MTVELNPNLTFNLTALDGGGFDSRLPDGTPATPPPSSGTPYFSDDFESGDLSKSSTSDGSTWVWTPTGVTVDNSAAHTGANSASLVYGPDANGDDSWLQLNFKFGKEVREFWMEYWLYIPANFFHRDQDSAPNTVTNNKFFAARNEGSNFEAWTVEFIRRADGTSDLKRPMSNSQFPGGGNNWPTDESEYVPKFIGPDNTYFCQTGQWNKIGMRFKGSTDGTSPDGRMEVWANDVLVKGFDWAIWSNTYGNLVDGGYIMGWANSGYTNATEFRIDDVKVFLTDPGWGA